jgi:hypothetical protein
MVSRKYFQDVYDNFKDDLKIFVAKLDNEVVTGSVDFQYRNGHYSWIGSPKSKIPVSPSPNDLLLWESVLYAYEHGSRFYITMSAAGNKRLHSYYAEKFNPELQIRYVASKKSFLSEIFEKGYTNIIKPFRGRMKNLKN